MTVKKNQQNKIMTVKKCLFYIIVIYNRWRRRFHQFQLVRKMTTISEKLRTVTLNLITVIITYAVITGRYLYEILSEIYKYNIMEDWLY